MCFFLSCMTGTVGFGIVPSRFGDNSIYLGENVTVQPYGPIAQCSEYSHGL